jgi:hypothetical protein
MLAFTKPDFLSLVGFGRMAPLPPGLVGLPNWLGARYFGLLCGLPLRQSALNLRPIARRKSRRDGSMALTGFARGSVVPGLRGECADARSRKRARRCNARRSWRYHRRVPRGAAYGSLEPSRERSTGLCREHRLPGIYLSAPRRLLICPMPICPIDRRPRSRTSRSNGCPVGRW